MAFFQAQPVGLVLFYRPAALSFAYVAALHSAHSALLGEKIVPAEPIQLVLTGPSYLPMILFPLSRGGLTRHI